MSGEFLGGGVLGGGIVTLILGVIILVRPRFITTKLGICLIIVGTIAIASSL